MILKYKSFALNFFLCNAGNQPNFKCVEGLFRVDLTPGVRGILIVKAIIHDRRGGG